MNPETGVQQVLDSLEAYADLSRTAVVLYLHRDGLAEGSLPPALDISALWFCGPDRLQPLEYVLRQGLGGGGPELRFGISA